MAVRWTSVRLGWSKDLPCHDDDDGDDGGDDGDGDGDDAEEEDEPLPNSYVNVGLTEVYVYAGNWPSLNAGLSSKVHYSNAPSNVDLTKDGDPELPGNQISGIEVTIDTVQPVLFGWTQAEVEPNDISLSGDSLDMTTAQDLGEATGLGYVDTITGYLDYETDNPQYTDIIDAFAITVPETSSALITFTMADAAYNSDIHIWDADGNRLAEGYLSAAGDVNPEVFHTDEFGVTFEPGVTYYLALFTWSGPAGGHDYTIEIEWQ